MCLVVVPTVGSFQSMLVLSNTGIPRADALGDTNSRLQLCSTMCMIGGGDDSISIVEVWMVSGDLGLLLGCLVFF